MLLTNNVPEFLSSAGSGHKDLHRAEDLAARLFASTQSRQNLPKAWFMPLQQRDKRGL
jgi:hypothetical protein